MGRQKTIHWFKLGVIFGCIIIAGLIASGASFAQAGQALEVGSLQPNSKDSGYEVSMAEEPTPTAPESESWIDHRNFPSLQGELASGPEVTQACLSCHSEAAHEIMSTTHWTWEYTHPETGQELGVRNIINSFWTSIESNEPFCTSCHVGYGWEDDTFDFSSEQAVDCLVCHDTTGTYEKFPVGAGHPVYVTTTYNGEKWTPPDLSYIAMNVGRPTRSNCGTCHFYGGGDDGVKHGDLDSSLINPDRSLDVHMDASGNNFNCTTCHQSDGHLVSGSRYSMNSSDEDTCETCHSEEPHLYYLLNQHEDAIACQTCHIPEFARGGVPTRLSWDWSQAGRLLDGEPFIEKNENGDVIYDSTMGAFEVGENLIPEYVWFNGEFTYSMLDHEFEMDDEGTALFNSPGGSNNSDRAKIWPMKIFRGTLPYDTENDTLVVPNLYGQADTAYWNGFDWTQAIETGMSYAGIDYSGKYDFINTKVYWPLTHMIAPGNESLTCDDCHSEQGRLDFIALGYSAEEAERLINFPPAFEIEMSFEEGNTPEYCATCHGVHYERWDLSIHSDNSVGCVSCHRIERGGEHPMVPYTSEKSADVCGACHLDHYYDWETSVHAQQEITCGVCHEPHNQNQRVVEGNETSCDACHQHHTTTSALSTHDAEGLTCNDCHKNTVTDTGHNFGIYVGTCLSCHKENIHSSDNQLKLQKIINETGVSSPFVGEVIEAEPLQDDSAILSLPTWASILLGMVFGIGIFWVFADRNPKEDKKE
jgi:octaheme c-type cytochrome (tetrathionate reductase family)